MEKWEKVSMSMGSKPFEVNLERVLENVLKGIEGDRGNNGRSHSRNVKS